MGMYWNRIQIILCRWWYWREC